MKYTATTPVMSVHDAEDLGKWLAKYAVEIAGLEVWQVGASGELYKDQPLADMVTTAVGTAASGALGGAVGAMAGPALLPLLQPRAARPSVS